MKKLVKLTLISILALTVIFSALPVAASSYNNYSDAKITIINAAPKELVYSLDNLTKYDIKTTYVKSGGKKFTGSVIDILDKDYDKYNVEWGSEGYKVKYNLKPSASITIYCELNNGKVLTKKTTASYSKKKNTLKIIKCNVDKSYFFFYSKYSAVSSATVKSGGKKKSVKASDSDLFYNYSNNYEYKNMYNSYVFKKYVSSYSIKAKQKVKVTIKTKDGFTYTKTVKAKAIKPKLKVSTIYAGDNRIKGSTKAKSKVTAKIKGKKYTAKANKKGKFSIKVKGYKYKTLVKVSVNTPQNCTTSKKLRVNKVMGDLSIPSYILRTSKKVTVKVTKARKGDVVKLKIGGKTYKKSIRKNAKSSKVVFNTSNLATDAKVTASYFDKFGTRKSSNYYDKVYYSNSIGVGMSTWAVQRTTWGRPTRTYNYSSFLMWVFESGRKTLYAYIRNGVVYKYSSYTY